ncbi:MAG: RpoL/Rpb11 RNA polymerase subunit family protein [Candidatus Methanomethylophilaceae archaeon]|jgi:DNA-directed RNA polymerase subunit L
MDLHLIEKTSDSILISIKDPDMTIITPLLNRLMQRDDVLDVQFTDKHPELEEPRLMVLVDKGDPTQAIRDTALSISKDFADARASISL